jgi:hypothetical protein
MSRRKAPAFGKLCQTGKMRCMTTVTMNISLTEDLKSFVDSRIKDEERQAEERLKTLIEEGIASGPAGDWKNLRAEFLAASGVKPAIVEKPRAERTRKAA